MCVSILSFPAEQRAKAVHLFSSPLLPPSGLDSLEDNSDDYEEPDLSLHGVHRVNTADRVKSVKCFLPSSPVAV